eukprot:TRINITY_DN31765_c0_g1_i1.p1 TRINITY_DN31765_c0_g1~~TRINITY_DN31765_c0_g1_i1.p1  ORF type:complete len:324 (+),score=67.27 TRINITY_DN31765_c0_g1_i1:42-974(+)
MDVAHHGDHRISPQRLVANPMQNPMQMQALMAGAQAVVDRKGASISESTRQAEIEVRRAQDRLRVMEDQLETERQRNNEIQFKLEQKSLTATRLEEQNRGLRDELRVAQDRVQVLQPDALRYRNRCNGGMAAPVPPPSADNDIEMQLNKKKIIELSSKNSSLQLELTSTKQLLDKYQQSSTEADEIGRLQDQLLKWEVADISSKKLIADLQQRLKQYENPLSKKHSEMEFRLMKAESHEKEGQIALQHAEEKNMMLTEQLRKIQLASTPTTHHQPPTWGLHAAPVPQPAPGYILMPPTSTPARALSPTRR